MSAFLDAFIRAGLAILGLSLLGMAACGRTAPGRSEAAAPDGTGAQGTKSEPSAVSEAEPTAPQGESQPEPSANADPGTAVKPGDSAPPVAEPDDGSEAPARPAPAGPAAASGVEPRVQMLTQFRSEPRDRSCQKDADCQVMRGPGPGCCDRYALNAAGVERLQAGRWLDRRCRDHRCKPLGLPACDRGTCVEGSTAPAPPNAAYDTSVVDKTIERRARAFDACYQRELKRDPGLAGDVEVEFRVRARGNVTDARVTDDTTGNAQLGECVRRAVARLRFNPAPGADTGPHRHRFSFAP